MEPLVVTPSLTIGADHLSVSFTRALPEDEDSAAHARTTPSVVELRCDTRGLELSQESLSRIRAHPELRSDARGVLRVTCDEHRSRAQNVAGARHRLATLIGEALSRPVQAAPEPPPKRRAGLMKKASKRAGDKAGDR